MRDGWIEFDGDQTFRVLEGRNSFLFFNLYILFLWTASTDVSRRKRRENIYLFRFEKGCVPILKT